jgi:uncharacterized membrane protein YfcA
VSTAQSFALLAVAVGAAAQATTGIGFSLVCAPLLTLALGGDDGVRLTNLLAIPLNGLVLAREWHSVMVDKALQLFGPAAVAATIAAVAVRHASPGVLSVAAGLLVLAVVAAVAAGARIRRLAGWHGALLAGAASGAMNVVGGVGGPAVASYAANAEWPPGRARATFAAYFLAINVVSVAARGVAPTTVAFGLSLAAALLIGFAVGAALGRRLRPGAIRRGMLILAAVGAAAAVGRGLL